MKEITLFNILIIVWDLNNTMIGVSFLYSTNNYVLGIHLLFLHIGIKIPKLTTKKKPFDNIEDYIQYKEDEIKASLDNMKCKSKKAFRAIQEHNILLSKFNGSGIDLKEEGSGIDNRDQDYIH